MNSTRFIVVISGNGCLHRQYGSSPEELYRLLVGYKYIDRDAVMEWARIAKVSDVLEYPVGELVAVRLS